MVTSFCQEAQNFHESDAATRGCFAEETEIVRSGTATKPLRYGQLNASITFRRHSLDAPKQLFERMMYGGHQAHARCAYCLQRYSLKSEG